MGNELIVHVPDKVTVNYEGRAITQGIKFVIPRTRKNQWISSNYYWRKGLPAIAYGRKWLEGECVWIWIFLFLEVILYVMDTLIRYGNEKRMTTYLYN